MNQFYADVAARNKAEYEAWQSLFAKYGESYPDEKREIERMFGREVKDQVEAALRDMAKAAADTPASTRVLSGKALNAIKDFMPELVSGRL